MNNSASFYFDYKIEQIQDDFNCKIKRENYPMFFVERNYSSPSLDYELFLVIPEWFDPLEDDRIWKRSELMYDKVNIVIDYNGIDIDHIDDINNNEREAEKSIDIVFTATGNNSTGTEEETNTYRGRKYRISLGANEDFNFSSVGRLVFTSSKPEHKGKKLVYYFAINFLRKKKIQYKILKKSYGLLLEFFGKNINTVINAKLAYGLHSYKCLKGDSSKDSSASIVIDFSKSNEKVVLKMTWEEIFGRDATKAQENSKFNILFDNKKFESENIKLNKLKVNYDSFYLFDCLENETLNIVNELNIPSNKVFCPYCHREIINDESANRDEFLKKYKVGQLACDGTEGKDIANESNKFPIEKKVESKYQVLKKTLFCINDAKEGFRDFPRLLPANFLEHNFNRVLIIGSPRSGKSTFISRTFDITTIRSTSNENVLIPKIYANGLKNSVSKLLNKVELDYYIGNKIVYNKNTNPHFLYTEDRSYTPNKDQETIESAFYSNYGIDCGDSKQFLGPTDISNTNVISTSFMLEVNNKDYIGFYDIAGELCKDGNDPNNIVGQLTQAKNFGIFLIVNGAIINGRGDSDRSLANKNTDSDPKTELMEIIGKINSVVGKGDNCPVAVILTKFDILANEFLPSCACLRDDYFDQKYERYEGSYLEKIIDFSSEEIKSYIENNGNGFKFDFPNIKNVKFFNVSAFPVEKSLSSNGEDKNFMNFKTSPNRIELPIIWMLKQRGIII